eukprot:2241534-Karenia_brevis.AAC.1
MSPPAPFWLKVFTSEVFFPSGGFLALPLPVSHVSDILPIVFWILPKSTRRNWKDLKGRVCRSLAE